MSTILRAVAQMKRRLYFPNQSIDGKIGGVNRYLNNRLEEGRVAFPSTSLKGE